MHDTAFLAALEFLRIYCTDNKSSVRILDVGGRPDDKHPELPLARAIRDQFPHAEYVVLDLESVPGVDAVYRLGQAFPFEDESFDYVLNSSSFQHDPCFWVTFCEMCRVLKPNGHIYVNAPANGPFQRAPADNWRFYGDAGQALAYWAGRNGLCVQVLESFHVPPCADQWIDYVCVWGKCEDATKEFLLSESVRDVIGPLEAALRQRNIRTVQMIEVLPVAAANAPLESIPEDEEKIESLNSDSDDDK
jgi:SAM-dependent methyltransferase